MNRPATAVRGARASEAGQILVIAALGMITMIGGVSLVIEGGNAYAHQRIVQNGVDSIANAGATVIAQKIGGATRTDGDVTSAMTNMANENDLDGFTAYYTNVTGELVAADGLVTNAVSLAVQVGTGAIPANTQGVRVNGTQAFNTTFGRVIGFNQFTAGADATAVSGALTGGVFLPVVFPVAMKDCDGSGELTPVDAPWRMSNPGSPHPVGQEWIVPLCKTGGGSFMILDLDPDKSCTEEVTNPSSIQFHNFPVDVATDTGNDCAKKIEEAMGLEALQGQVVLIPICDGECSTVSGNNGTYHIVRIAAFFLDYLSFSNNDNNSACALTTSPTYNTSMINIVGGNGSSSCMAGWFVRYVTSGPVGAGTIADGEAIGVQLIR